MVTIKTKTMKSLTILLFTVFLFSCGVNLSDQKEAPPDKVEDSAQLKAAAFPGYISPAQVDAKITSATALLKTANTTQDAKINSLTTDLAATKSTTAATINAQANRIAALEAAKKLTSDSLAILKSMITARSRMLDGSQFKDLNGTASINTDWLDARIKALSPVKFSIIPENAGAILPNPNRIIFGDRTPDSLIHVPSPIDWNNERAASNKKTKKAKATK